MPYVSMPVRIEVDMRRIQVVRLLDEEGGVMRAVICEVELRAALNIMFEGMRYWYVHASSLGRW